MRKRSTKPGFIRRLPHQLIRAFHSTLEEAIHADLLLLVCDISDPECAEHLEVTRNLLTDLGAGDIPQLVVYNKCDLSSSFDEARTLSNDERVFISAAAGMGIEDLLNAISAILKANKKEVVLCIPYSSAGLLNTLRGECPILGDAEYQDDGIIVKTVLDDKNYHKFMDFIVGQEQQ